MARYVVRLERFDDHVTARSDAFDITIDADTVENAVNETINQIEKQGANMIRRKESLPPEDGLEEVSAVAVDIDIQAYYRRTSTEAVRRTVSLPMYLDDQIRDKGLDSSKIFQEAIQKELDKTDRITTLEEARRRIDPELLKKVAAMVLLDQTKEEEE